MATRGQLLRSYVNQFGELLVANRKLQVEAGINRVQEQVAKGLVTPPSDEPLRDNRLYKEAWRDARSENMGREAGRLLMDDVPAMIAEAMEGYRYDQEGETPSERMTYLVDEWWSKHKRNVGFDDLSFNPNYTQQWEAAKTRAYGALRDVVQTETTKQALNEARGVIQTRLEQTGYEGDPNVFLSNSSFYKGIRDELVGMNYPLIRSQIEGLLHDEVISSNMNILNDPLSQESDWKQALDAVRALDEQGFGDNGMSLSEIVTGKKSPESEASTRAQKLFQARIKQQNEFLKKEGEKALDENYRMYQAMPRKELKSLTWRSIANSVPVERLTTMRTLYFKAEDTEDINGGEQRRLHFTSRFQEFKTVTDLKNAMLEDPVLSLKKWDEDFEKTVQEYIDYENEGVRISQLADTTSNQLFNYESITDEDLLEIPNIIELTQKINEGKGLSPSQVISLTKRKKILEDQKDKENYNTFINFMNNKDLVQLKEPSLRKSMKEQGLDKSQIQDVLEYRKTLLADPGPALKRKIEAGEKYAYYSNPENEEELLKIDFSKLPKDLKVLESDEGYQRWQDLINLQRAVKLNNTEAEITRRRERADRSFKWLTQGDLADAMLLATDLTDELVIYNGWDNDQIRELRARQTLLQNEEISEELKAKLEDKSFVEMVRLHNLGDDLLKEDLAQNKLLNEEHKKTVISWQTAIRVRDQSIQAARTAERRDYWKTHYLDDENVLELINATTETLQSHLGVETPELAEVLNKQLKENEIRKLPSNQRTYQRNMWNYINDPKLWGIDIATIQDAFPQFDKSGREIGGQNERITKILTKQSSLKDDRAKEQEIRDKAKLEKAPKILSKQYHSKINAVLMDGLALPEDQISQLRGIAGEIRTKVDDLDEGDFSELLKYVETEANALETEIEEAPLYSTKWRPTVTKLFTEQIIYPGDNIVSITVPGSSLNTDIATRTNTLRLKSADRRELHKHMKGVYDKNRDWNTDQIAEYLNEYLPEYADKVRKKITSITELDDVPVTPGITEFLEQKIDPKVLKRIKEMPVSDKTKRKMLLLRKKPNPINTN